MRCLLRSLESRDVIRKRRSSTLGVARTLQATNNLWMLSSRLIALLLLLTSPRGLMAQASKPAEEKPDPPSETAAVPKEPHRVHLVLDRFREVSGELVSEDDISISIKRENRTETYERNKCLAIVHLLNIKEGGQEGVVFLRDGSALDALVIADDYGAVVVLIEGIEHELPRSDVAYVQLKPTFEERLAHARNNFRPDDLEARIELAKWIIENGRLQLAKEELTAVLAQDDHPEAKQLIKLLDARIALETTATEGLAPRPPKVDRTAGIPKRKLTPDDVNIIRVFEIDFANPPKVTVGANAVKELIRTNADHPLIPTDARGREALYSLRDIDKVKLIFDTKARELYSEIKVESEPHSLELFRKRVHNAWLIRNCATSGCHGGTNAGRFYLHRYDTSDPRTVYENLLILERLNLGGSTRLIDYENPSLSLIIQHALPPSAARYPHPEVPGYEPVFPSDGGRMQRETENFIRSMYRPRPKYPVQFEPPTQKEPLQAAPPPRVPR